MAELPPSWFVNRYTKSPSAQEEIAKPANKQPGKMPPQWFVDQYTKSPKSPDNKVPNKQPAELGSKDTQQERERLTGPELASTRRQLDPSTLTRLSDRYALSADRPPLTTPPVRSAVSRPEGKKVFTNPEQLEQIFAEAPDAGKAISFKKAFKLARTLGKDEFEYKGDRFNTRERDETLTEWAEALKTSKEFPFSAYMAEANIQSAPGKTVDIKGIDPAMGTAIEKLTPILKAAGIKGEITSGKRSQDNWSLHEVGEAFDIRLKTAGKEALKKLKATLPGNPVSISIRGKKGQMWRDGDFEYVVHGAGNRIHLHVERETAETKEKLANYLIERGSPEIVSVQGLRKYPNLLNKLKDRLPKVN